MTKNIVISGGDVISDIPLHYYVLAQSQSIKPKVCLLSTPSGDSPYIIRQFMEIFSQYNCEADYLPLFHNKENNHKDFLLKQDIIMICGGQSKSTFGVFREWGIDKILLEAYNKGIILSGGSAGGVQFFDEAITDSFGDLRPMKFMGFLPYSHCPHYRADERRRVYKAAILEKRIKPGYAVSDSAHLHFRDGQFFRAVASASDASSFFVDIDARGKEEKIHSERLPTSWLGSRMVQEELIWGAPAFRHMVTVEPEAVEEVTEQVPMSEVMD